MFPGPVLFYLGAATAIKCVNVSMWPADNASIFYFAPTVFLEMKLGAKPLGRRLSPLLVVVMILLVTPPRSLRRVHFGKKEIKEPKESKSQRSWSRGQARPSAQQTTAAITAALWQHDEANKTKRQETSRRLGDGGGMATDRSPEEVAMGKDSVGDAAGRPDVGLCQADEQ